MSNSQIRDNHKHGKVGEFLLENLKQDCKIDVVSAYFTIYAYYNLQEHLDEIESMRFLFGEPTFIKEVDPTQRNYKSYRLEYDREEEQLRIPMQTRLMQKTIAKECYDFLRVKAEILDTIRGVNNKDINPEYLRDIPIPLINRDNCAQYEKYREIINLVDGIISAIRSEPSADTSALEAEIDRMVYELYDLREDEIKAVEGGVK